MVDVKGMEMKAAGGGVMGFVLLLVVCCWVSKKMTKKGFPPNFPPSR